MNQSGERGRKRTIGVTALIALLASALFVEGIPVLHAHDAAEPALYNEECTLAQVAAHSVGGPVPFSPSDGSLQTVVEGRDLPIVPAPSPPALSTPESRAPPVR
jgi:hypothetical protein